MRVLCSETCKTNYRNGERVRRRAALAAAPAAVARADDAARAVRDAASRQPRVVPLEESPRPRAKAEQAHARLTVACFWIGAATVGTAAMLAGFTGPQTARTALFLACVGALAGMRATWRTAGEVSLLGWLLQPLGFLLAVIAAYLDAEAGQTRLDAFGAVIAASALLGRGLLDLRTRQPIEQATQGFRRLLPRQVHVPAPDLAGSESITETAETARIRIGEEIVAGHGESLGVDGVIRAGEANVFPYPGASAPLRRGPGDAVLAGTQVADGSIRVLAGRVGAERALARVSMVADAKEPGGSRFLRRLRRAMPWTAAFSLVLCAGWCIARHLQGASLPLWTASSILIATPLLALLRAAHWPLQRAAAAAAERGILFQSSRALELAGQASVLAFAPYRTLTEGKPEVLDVLTFGDEGPEARAALLGLAAGAELSTGDHPIGRAIIQYADKRGIAPREMRRAKAVPGRGLIGTGPDGEDVVIGSRRLLLDQAVSVAIADAYAAQAEGSGRTAVFMAVSGRVRAVFALQDQLRPGARAAVQRFFDLGLEVVLLTGDQRGPVEHLASGLDIAHIKCELSPEDRAAEIANLREAGGPVAVIGYPADDAATLAAADVAIALGAAGSGHGDHEIALLSEDLRDAAVTLWIARAARSRQQTALRVSLGAFIGLTAAAFGGLIGVPISACVALLVDAYGMHAGARLVRRVALRLGSSR